MLRFPPDSAQRRHRTPDQAAAAGRHLWPAPALTPRRLEPTLERPLADPEAPCDFSLAAFTGLTGSEHALA
jgi:hypothetical protein